VLALSILAMKLRHMWQQWRSLATAEQRGLLRLASGLDDTYDERQTRAVRGGYAGIRLLS
jgi:hypothetical protein